MPTPPRPPSELGFELRMDTEADEARLRQLLELEPADPPAPEHAPAPEPPTSEQAVAYAHREVTRLRELEGRLEEQLRETRDHIIAVRGGINAYLDMINLLSGGTDGLDYPGHLG